MNKPIGVLLAEDSDDDFALVVDALRSAGYAPAIVRVESAAEMQEALSRQRWDVVLSDYKMPQFDALRALATLKASPQSELPFIIVSGSIGEVLAVAALKAGSADYVMKDNLEKLGPVIERELGDAKARRERREALSALREAIKARDDFLSVASHELKTPLTALALQLQGLLKTLQEHDPANELPFSRLLASATAADRSSKRLQNLVEQLLEITAAGAGSLELTVERLDLSSLVREVCDGLADVFRNAGSDVAIHAPSALFGFWDRRGIERVVVSLCTNAARFGLGRPVEITLAEQDDGVGLSVTDHGIGIAPEDQRRIFEQFERAVSQRNYGGFGMGLWLAERIARAHGGEIGVSSEPGTGSTFKVTLPKDCRRT